MAGGNERWRWEDSCFDWVPVACMKWSVNQLRINFAFWNDVVWSVAWILDLQPKHCIEGIGHYVGDFIIS